MTRQLRHALLVLLAAVMACGGSETPTATLKLVSDLTILAHGRPPPPEDADRAAAAIAEGRLDVDTLIEDLLEAPRLGAVAKSVVVTPSGVIKSGQPVPRATLRTVQVEGKGVYTLGRTCTLEDSVKVRPWWRTKGTVRVCNHAYRPDVLVSEDGRMCGASTMLPGGAEGCGCGPRLMWCVRNDKQRTAMLASLRAEVDDTVAFVVNHDLPLEQLFLMNATVRDRYVETIYRRSAVAAGADPDILDARDHPSTPTLLPRDDLIEGQHAGILTAAGLIFTSDALRGVMRDYYSHLWCARTSSSGVTTERVMNLGVVDLRVGDGWQQLAAMDICTDCHARLDYGMQFFAGYPSSTMGIDFRPDQALDGAGPLYSKHIGDQRGVDALTPQGFARLALTQPEFGECMAEKVVGHVLGDRATPDDRDAVLLAFEDEHTYKAMMRIALQRFAAHATTPAGATDSDPVRPPRAGLADHADDSGVVEDGVALPMELVRSVDNHCAHCHDGIDLVDLTGTHLPASTVNFMLEQVAFGSMPLGPSEFTVHDRDAFVEAAITTLWPEPAAQEEARAFFASGQMAHATHRFRAATNTVATRAEVSKIKYMRGLQTTVEPRDRSFTPGMATSIGLVALEACKSAGNTGDDLRACVLDASKPEHVLSGPVN